MENDLKVEEKESPWSKGSMDLVFGGLKKKDEEAKAANLATARQHKPLHQSSVAKGVLILGGAVALSGLLMFILKDDSQNAGTGSLKAAVETPEAEAEDKGGWKIAADTATGGLGVETDDVKKTPLSTSAPMVPASTPKTSPPAAKPTTPPATKASSPVVVAKAPPAQPQIVYRPMPPPVAKSAATPQPSPQSFIPLGNGQQVQRRERRIRSQRQPLVASEKALMDSLKPKAKAAPAVPVGDPLIAGQTISVHLMSTLQFTNQTPTAMQVMLDQPLRTSGGGQIPRRSILLFQTTVNPQNGAISAISGDAIYNGKTIRIQKGAMSLEATNRERTTRSPLVAQSVNLREGELAAADRNNALIGIAGGIGDELTKGSSSVTVGNGSTIINQGNNVPNIWGGALKGASQSVLTDQRQRTQTKASQILSAPPVQSLRGDTSLLLTVTFPAPISIAR